MDKFRVPWVIWLVWPGKVPLETLSSHAPELKQAVCECKPCISELAVTKFQSAVITFPQIAKTLVSFGS